MLCSHIRLSGARSGHLPVSQTLGVIWSQCSLSGLALLNRLLTGSLKQRRLWWTCVPGCPRRWSPSAVPHRFASAVLVRFHHGRNGWHGGGSRREAASSHALSTHSLSCTHRGIAPRQKYTYPLSPIGFSRVPLWAYLTCFVWRVQEERKGFWSLLPRSSAPWQKDLQGWSVHIVCWNSDNSLSPSPCLEDWFACSASSVATLFCFALFWQRWRKTLMGAIFHTVTINFYFSTRKEKSSKWNVLLWRKAHAGRKETHKALNDIIDKRKSLETFRDAQWTWLVGVWRKLIDSCFWMRVERGFGGMNSSFHLDACLLTLQTEINALKYFLSNFTQKVVSLTRRGIACGLHFWLEREEFLYL